MDYPHGRHPHHGGVHRRDEDEEERRYGYPPPARPHSPPFYGGDAPPPPQVNHTSHMGPPPPQPHLPPFYVGGAPPPSPPAYHTSHMGPPGPAAYHPPPPPTVANLHPPPPPTVTNFHPNPGLSPPGHPHSPPSADHHHHHHKEDELSNKPPVKMYCKADPGYALTIRDGKVVLAPADPSDLRQSWVKDERLSTRVKDEEGFPSFALVNKATRQAIKHSFGATHPVQLSEYNPSGFDESILWTESKDLGDGYRAIRMVNNIRLNIDAFNGDKNHGGVRDGTKIVLWEWKKGDNQRWKIVPYFTCTLVLS
ncbi:hydroxyproline-rich glycoprotein family protein [Striga hermonthica]|uniref:Hydroxyproline-rich glycoprotein family protein n=1 Tax=Striga hermonthica TaxID=68872 RepID=A0A9N7MUH3_STRHE|nr:hydroxyproline-rich glycoprotein family protein [Striga hermonthica]